MRATTHVDTYGTVTRRPVTQARRCPKLAYSTRKLAQAKAVESRRHTGENIVAFHCYSCHCYHLGHPPGEPRLLVDVAR